MKNSKERLEYAIKEYVTGVTFNVAHMYDDYPFTITDDHYIDLYGSNHIMVYSKKDRMVVHNSPGHGKSAIVYEHSYSRKIGNWGRIVSRGFQDELEEILKIIYTD